MTTIRYRMLQWPSPVMMTTAKIPMVALSTDIWNLNSDSDEDVRRPSEKPVMYEADHDTGESGTAVRLGMEDASAAAKAQHRREVMPLAKRKAMESEEIRAKPQVRMRGLKKSVYSSRLEAQDSRCQDRATRESIG